MSSFDVLTRNYPGFDPCDAKNKSGQLLFSNQCAIRLSHALKKSGVNLATFPQKRKCWVHPKEHHVLAAKELADWIEGGHVSFAEKSSVVTGQDWRDKVLDRTGIICFEDYYTPSGGNGGDHIDLWDGSALTSLGSWLRTRFNIVIPGVWSDLRNARKTRFFPVK